MHPEIVKFLSNRFYEGKLLSGLAHCDCLLPASQFDWKGSSIVFMDVVDGKESFSCLDGLKSNPQQTKVCKDIVEGLQHKPISTCNKLAEEVQRFQL